MELPRPQSRAEELANAITHGAGAVLGFAALLTMSTRAIVGDEGGVTIAAAVVYGISLVVLFGASATYHWVREPRLKRALQTVDHCAIHLLIAGTYTPFAVVSLGGVWGWSLFAAVWSLAALGLVLEIFVEERWERVSVGLYLGMGWLGVLAAVPFIRVLSPWAIGLVLAGGLLYTAGTWFYARDRPWDHVVWHGFVLGGAGTHGLAVLGFVI